jgi:hypothetical protein
MMADAFWFVNATAFFGNHPEGAWITSGLPVTHSELRSKGL